MGAPCENTICRPCPNFLRTWLPALIVAVSVAAFATAATRLVRNPPPKPDDVYPFPAQGEAAMPAQFFAKIPLCVDGFRSVSLISADRHIKEAVEQHKAKLMEVAANEFANVTVEDLDKPGALDAERARLLKKFNHALDDSMVQEVYIAEWPQQ